LAPEKCGERYTEVRLRELTPDQSRQMVRSLLVGDSLPDEVETLILERAQGNPFFLEELIRSLIDSGHIVREHGLTYSQFMHGVKLAGIDIDRKVLSDLAIREPEAFAAIVASAQAAIENAAPAAA
jgi:predicted ATPase